MTPELRARFTAFRTLTAQRARENEARRANDLTTKAKLTQVEETLARRMRERNLIRQLGDLTGEIDHDEAALSRLRDDTNWTPVAIVVVGQYQECAHCHRRSNATSGFFMREKHNYIPSAVRLKRLLDIPQLDIPMELALEGVVLPRCIECVGQRATVDDLLAAALHDVPPFHTNQLNLPEV